MTDYVSILTCFSETAAPTNEDEDLNTEEKKEVEETVEDLLSMKNQEMLKKNLVNIVTENLRNKKKVKILESDLADRKENISFLIDCDGQDGQEEDSHQSHQSHQSQQRVYSDFTVLGETSEPESPAASKGGSCFNCDGSHIVSECAQPRDEDKIARRRSEMKGSKGPTSARYHLEGGQKFDHLQPGLPSDKLREALGLRSDELPRYIYDMRELGYPPGWLVAARVTNSGLALYHTGDTKMDTGEEGEVEAGPEKYDIDKLVTWPGFNAELPRKFRDDSSWYNVRPLSSQQNISHFAKKLKAEKQTRYVKGDMLDVSTENINHVDMAVSGEEGDDNEDTAKVQIVTTPAKERVKATDPGRD